MILCVNFSSLLSWGLWIPSAVLGCDPGRAAEESVDARSAYIPISSPSTGFVAVLAAQDTDPNSSSRVWFGVNLDLPGPALCKQLQLENKLGLVITNVSKGSPADQSGVEQYDVLIVFDEKEVPQDIEVFADRLQEIGSDRTAGFEVLRNAQRIVLSTQLARRPNTETWEWKYDASPDQVFQHNYSVFGKMLRRLPSGEVEVDDLGKINQIPLEFQILLPDFQEKRTEWWEEDGLLQKKSRVIREVDSIEIFQDPGGPIRIRHIFPGQETPAAAEEVYATAEDLKEANEEAYRIYQELEGGSVSSMGTPDAPAAHVHWYPIGDSSDLSAGDFSSALQQEREAAALARELQRERKVDEWRQALEENIRQSAHDRLQKAKQAQVDARATATELVQILRESLTDHSVATQEPQFRFHQTPEGKVEVSIRRQDSELTMIFASPEELKEKKPSLFERYQSLESSE